MIEGLGLSCFDLSSAVSFREIDVKHSPNEVLLLPIDIHLTLRGLQATHASILLAGLLLQSCLIGPSILGGVWNSGAAPAEVHRGAAVPFENIVAQNGHSGLKKNVNLSKPSLISQNV